MFWNILHTIEKRKYNCIGHVLRRNCLLKHVIEEKVEATRTRGRRRKQLLDDLKENRRYWNFKRGSTRSHCVEKLPIRIMLPLFLLHIFTVWFLSHAQLYLFVLSAIKTLINQEIFTLTCNGEAVSWDRNIFTVKHKQIQQSVKHKL
jgi:hypothetical protein